jgi:hypothetical protein
MIRVRGAALLLLAACGRIGFDGGSTATPDTGSPGSVPALCNVHDVATLSLDTSGAVALRALATQTGYVVAISTTRGNIYVARVPESLDSAELHLPLTPEYTLGGLSAIGDRIYIHTKTGGVGYLKLLDATFDTYMTIESGDDRVIDPATSRRTAGTGWRLNIAGGTLDIQEMAADGTRTGLVSSYTPATQAATIDQNRVVTVVGNDCQTMLLSDGGTPGQLHEIAGCAEPRLAVLEGGQALIAMRITATEWVVYRVPAEASATGVVRSLGDITGARIASADTAAWVVYERGGIAELARYDAASNPPGVTTLPEVSSPFDLAHAALFWLAGTTLRVGTPCLR